MHKHIIKLLIFCVCFSCAKQEPKTNAYSVLNEKDRAALRDDIIDDRFNNLLPQLMDAAAIDMWVVISREYNEDPVIKTMLPSVWLNARRRTILVFLEIRKKTPSKSWLSQDMM